LARRARLCFACLEPGHYASGCKHRGGWFYSVPFFSYWSLPSLFYWTVKSLSYWFSFYWAV
ncbi:hypothetical protein T12_1214, partial [Trichinella patagoniensis]